MPPAGYFSNVNPDLLKFIPPDVKTVLEIGCGEGALCEAYRRVNPGVEWLGIELSDKASKVAESKGIKILGDDCECWSWKGGCTETEPADCLVLGDVLEHLRDPWKTLEVFTTYWLKPGAQVLACIPNVQHWTVIRDLLNGKWEYTDSGLLDRTHLRFFTLDSIRKMFSEAGLQVFEIVGRDLFNEGFASWSANLGRENTKELRAYQYVVRAIKPIKEMTIEDCEAGQEKRRHMLAIRGVFGPKPIPKLHIHAVTAEDCCARPRIHEPFAMLSTIPGVRCSTADRMDGPSVNQREDERLVWIQQRHRRIDLDDQDTLLGSGKLIIAEVDDMPEAIGMDPMALKAVHAVQCSTEALAEVCRKYNPNVMVFENQIAELEPLRTREPNNVVGLFFGAQNRETDWAPIMPALNRVLADHPGVFVHVIHDRKFYEAINAGAKQFHPFSEYDRYRELLGWCDIALLPLEDTPFNRCKSDIKFLECAAEGVAVLAGDTAYHDAFLDAIPLMCVSAIYRSADDFGSKLRRLIELPEARLSQSHATYAYVRDNRLLSQHYRKRYEWYQSLLSSKPTLDRQLLERVPELRSTSAVEPLQPAL